MIGAMVAGALILLVGLVIGFFSAVLLAAAVRNPEE